MKGYIIAFIGGPIIFNDYLANFSSRNRSAFIPDNFPAQDGTRFAVLSKQEHQGGWS